MNFTINVSPRMAGKTQDLISNFAKKPNNTLVIVHSLPSAKVIHRKLEALEVQYNKNHIVTQGQDIRGLSSDIQAILMDEYLYFDIKNRTRLYSDYDSFNAETVRIYSTAQHPYSFRMMSHVVNFKERSEARIVPVTGEEIWTYLLANGYPYTVEGVRRCAAIEEFTDLYYNHLTDRDITKRSHVVYWPKQDWNIALANRLASNPDMCPTERDGIVVML